MNDENVVTKFIGKTYKHAVLSGNKLRADSEKASRLINIPGNGFVHLFRTQTYCGNLGKVKKVNLYIFKNFKKIIVYKIGNVDIYL